MKSDIEAKLEDLLSRAESEVIEFKEAKSNYDFKKIGRYFSALANEANLKNSRHAWLVFGVRDDRTVVGTGYRTNTSDLHHLKSEIAQHTTSRITFQEIYEVQTELGRVILFQIAAAPQGMPIAWQGHYYGRDGEELNALATRLIPRKSGQVVGQILPQISLIPQIFIDFQEFAKTLYFQCVQLYVGSQRFEYWRNRTNS